MRKLTLGVLLAVASLAAGWGPPTASAADKPFVADFAGSCTNKSDFSFNGDAQGVTNHCTIAGRSTLGPYTAQLVVGGGFDGDSCHDGSGAVISGSGEFIVLSFAATSDQLILQFSSDPQLLCLDFSTGVISGSETFDVKGGTGRFVGATGTVIKNSQTTILFFAPLDSGDPRKGFFGSFTGTFTGTIKLAK